jgi:hypothetical protein
MGGLSADERTESEQRSQHRLQENFHRSNPARQFRTIALQQQ